MYVLRVQNKNDNKIGYYSCRIFKGHYLCEYRNPIPVRDKTFMNNLYKKRKVTNNNFYFGYTSFTQFRNWFYNSSINKYLMSYDVLELAIYKVHKNNVIIGDAQCAFLLDKATKVYSTRINLTKKVFLRQISLAKLPVSLV